MASSLSCLLKALSFLVSCLSSCVSLFCSSWQVMSAIAFVRAILPGSLETNATVLTQSGGVLSTSVADYLSNQDNNADDGRPKAFLNWILFDEHFNLVQSSSGADQVPEESWYQNSSAVYEHLFNDLLMEKSGYLFVYVSNESTTIPVYFDNLQVSHKRGAIIDETHYYPFGLAIKGLSSKAVAFGKPLTKLKYNGKEEQRQEFSDGSGLEWLDYGARMYDNQIGRWQTPDPLVAKYLSVSPYSFEYNNPILFVDLDGRENTIYLYATDKSVRKELKEIRDAANQNFANMGLKTRVKILKNPSKFKIDQLEKTDAVAVIGNTESVVGAVKEMNEKFAQVLKDEGFGSVGDGAYVERAQDGNYRDNSVFGDGGNQIIAISTGALRKAAKEFYKSSVGESGGFVITHAAGHLGGILDEAGRYQGEDVPNFNLMRNANRQKGFIMAGLTLNDIVCAPANIISHGMENGQPKTWTGPVAKAFLNKFGNETSSGKIPSE